MKSLSVSRVRACHHSRKRARKNIHILARLREWWHRVSDDGEGLYRWLSRHCGLIQGSRFDAGNVSRPRM